MGIKVKALRQGEYRTLREEGEEFEIDTVEHAGTWMKPVHAKDAEKIGAFLAEQAARREAARRVNDAPPGTVDTAAIVAAMMAAAEGKGVGTEASRGLFTIPAVAPAPTATTAGATSPDDLS